VRSPRASQPPPIRGQPPIPGTVSAPSQGKEHGLDDPAAEQDRDRLRQDVANAAVFAASDWAATMTATEINLTGGAVID
jgi:hypothetical protein